MKEKANGGVLCVSHDAYSAVGSDMLFPGSSHSRARCLKRSGLQMCSYCRTPLFQYATPHSLHIRPESHWAHSMKWRKSDLWVPKGKEDWMWYRMPLFVLFLKADLRCFARNFESCVLLKKDIQEETHHCCSPTFDLQQRAPETVSHEDRLQKHWQELEVDILQLSPTTFFFFFFFIGISEDRVTNVCASSSLIETAVLWVQAMTQITPFTGVIHLLPTFTLMLM